MNILGVIPARSGSKGILKKNIKKWGGIPLIVHTIKAAKKSNINELVVSTDSKEIANYIKSMRSHGFTKSLDDRYSKGRPWDYNVINPGFNYRLDEIRASLGLNQLKRINQLNSKRRIASKYLTKKFSVSPTVRFKSSGFK